MAKARILIVEDDINLLEGIRTVLQLEGYAVLTAEHGEVALNILLHEPFPPDLIVSDIMMPRMDGIQLLNEVRRRPEWMEIPFIFLTARSEKSDVVRGKRMGVDDYLVKPFDADDLLLAIESRLKRSEMIKKAKDEEITDLKQKILTILNHEFRTPLTFLVAYTDMLKEQQPNYEDDPETAMFLNGINIGALRLRRLIENFIYLVEMETGTAKRVYDLRRQAVSDLMEVLRAAHDHVFIHFPDRQCSIWVEDHLPTLMADMQYLTTAVVHLLENAVKFSTADQVVLMGAQRSGDEIMIWVQDHGRGISPAEQARIWESFYQVNRAVFEDQGAGAGLAIVRGVARLHGGRVELESELGKGSIFRLYLPVPSSAEPTGSSLVNTTPSRSATS
ncbi:MAG: hybrid sensor histidine kinase/response regulator [bacterium]|nr:hybrid sensor histidine kinase/response regulator [bacterium]